MREIKYSTQFKNDIKQTRKHNKNMDKLKAVMQLIANKQPLPSVLNDHELIGKWKHHRELHIESDWLLIYYFLDDKKVHFERTGSHFDLFR
ncbi:type II toxin-antitoxin system YafQ family toxin [Gilliamella sp. wkB112]|uniref:type II toxin-antitoxin system YafQ family toxin n=1 Tax=Gilliamella sp. wkB112 TaxID=3120257 RepID=UPI00080E0E53|nr:type II toxin-antitoxin system YafQ family toxin [Gilliamella apicola]OCG01480.1 mRNA interferase YafQ [Gilliamella apicola]